MSLSVLIVGGGSIGERHLRCFGQTGRCEVALCEIDDALRARLVDRYGLEQSFADLDRAAARTWDAAVICTPAHLHVDHALTLAPVTDALLIEKPLATRIEDAARLKQGVAGKVVGIAYVSRVHPSVREAQRILAEGTLGPLLQVTATSGQHFPTFRPAYRDIYYADLATGGGAIQDGATHGFNLIQLLAGRFDWVFCDYAHQALEGVSVDDTVHFVGRTGGGKTLVSLALNQFMAPNETILQCNGRDGSLQLRMHEHRLGIMLLGEEHWRWGEPSVHERDELFRLQAGAFLDAIDGKAPVLCDLDEATHTLRVNLAALASAGRQAVVIEADG